jgi:RNA polymerase sigma factor (sigma-70 family)
MFLRSSSHDTLTDEELIHRYRTQGEVKWAAQLFERYMPFIYGVCLQYLKDREASRDAVMDIYHRLCDTLLRHEVDRFKSWLHVLTKNHCLMALRAAQSRSRKEREEIYPELGMEWHSDAHPEEAWQVESHLEEMKKCMETLKEEQKQCVRLFYLDEKCYKEIADITLFDMKKVKSYIQNGKRNLKICIEKALGRE